MDGWEPLIGGWEPKSSQHLLVTWLRGYAVTRLCGYAYCIVCSITPLYNTLYIISRVAYCSFVDNRNQLNFNFRKKQVNKIFKKYFKFNSCLMFIGQVAMESYKMLRLKCESVENKKNQFHFKIWVCVANLINNLSPCENTLISNTRTLYIRIFFEF